MEPTTTPPASNVNPEPPATGADNPIAATVIAPTAAAPTSNPAPATTPVAPPANAPAPPPAPVVSAPAAPAPPPVENPPTPAPSPAPQASAPAAPASPDPVSAAPAPTWGVVTEPLEPVGGSATLSAATTPASASPDAALQKPTKPRNKVRDYAIIGAVVLVVAAGGIGTAVMVNRQRQVASLASKAQGIDQLITNTQPLSATPVEASAATPTATSTTSTSTSTQATTTSSTGTASNKPPAPTESTIESNCFSFVLPLPNEVTGDKTGCVAMGSIGTTASLTINPVTQSFPTLGAAIFFVKQIYHLDVVSERPVQLGGIDGYELIYNFGSEQGGPTVRTAKLLAPTTGKNYKTSDGTKITGFEIDITANDTASKAALAKFESTWMFK